MSSIDLPTEFDAVLGDRSITTPVSMVLGGIEGLKIRLNNENTQVKILALKDAINYGEAGLHLIIQYLENRELEVQNTAYFLLESRPESFVRERIDKSKNIRRYTRHPDRFALFENMGKEGKPESVDIMLGSLEADPSSSPHKLIDYTLGLVKNGEGKKRIEYYLFNGTQTQRNYAALYFKRLEEHGILTEAVKMGCIDRIQAFSK